MRLWVARDRIAPAMPLRPLATRMAKNVCVSMWRHERHTIAWHGETERDGRTTAPTTDIEEQDNAKLLQRAMSRLTTGEQRLMALRNEEGMEVGRIAAVTGLNPRSVSVMLSRARHKIMELLKKGENL